MNVHEQLYQPKKKDGNAHKRLFKPTFAKGSYSFKGIRTVHKDETNVAGSLQAQADTFALAAFCHSKSVFHNRKGETTTLQVGTHNC